MMISHALPKLQSILFNNVITVHSNIFTTQVMSRGASARIGKYEHFNDVACILGPGGKMIQQIPA